MNTTRRYAIKYIAIGLATLFLLTGCGNQIDEAQDANGTKTDNISYAVDFVDDEGNVIQLEQVPSKIVCLYSAHMENLFSLGAQDQIIGRYKTCIYPAQAATLPQYDYNSDPEKVIASGADVVLIRPFITSKAPEFVKALKEAGLTVVSLYPETYEAFDSYIQRLGNLVGREERAMALLAKQKQSIEDVSKLIASSSVEPQTIFFESTDVDVRTVTPDSMPGQAIEVAGGVNVASEVEPMKEGSSIANYGVEQVLAHANEIDVYVSQRGAMNSGGNLTTISQRPGFDTIKAVKEGRVYTINEKFISSPTFRYYKGIRELARFLYPEIMDDLGSYSNDELATRRSFANIIVRQTHEPMWLPTSSYYYDTKYDGHTYGWFEDTSWEDDDFDYIETAVMKSYLSAVKLDGHEYFEPDGKVTREDLARAIFMIKDFTDTDEQVEIADLDQCSSGKIVQNLVDNGIFVLEDGKFNPAQEVTNNEIIAAIKAAQ